MLPRFRFPCCAPSDAGLQPHRALIEGEVDEDWHRADEVVNLDLPPLSPAEEFEAAISRLGTLGGASRGFVCTRAFSSGCGCAKCGGGVTAVVRAAPTKPQEEHFVDVSTVSTFMESSVEGRPVEEELTVDVEREVTLGTPKPRRRSVQIIDRKPSEQMIPAKTDERRPEGISEGHVKRTSTYAALGLGYIIDPARHEQEIAFRAATSKGSLFAGPQSGGKALRFEDHYEILEAIAVGGFSTVFKVRPKGAKHSAAVGAVKKVLRSIVGPCEALGVFQTETSIFAELSHPNIAWRRQLFVDTESIYLVMDLLTGPSLFERLSRGSLPNRQVCRHLHEMLSGLAYCHGNGIIHRDIKPENFLFETDLPEARLKLVDFGLSRSFKRGDVITTRVGTLAYTAPEVLQGCYDERCDLWSVGCTVFLCSAGVLPIAAPNDTLLAHSIRLGAVSWHLLKELDHRAKPVVQALLARSPTGRGSALALSKHKGVRDAAGLSSNLWGALLRKHAL